MARITGWLLLCGFSAMLEVHATETTDLLDRFSNLRLETPARLHQQWEQSGSQSMDSVAFRQYYQQQFRRYAAMARRLSARTQACASGELAQAPGYSPSIDIGTTLLNMDTRLTETEENATNWVRTGSDASHQELSENIPRLTTGYARILFELSNCSGYLYGDPVH